ncbi:ABC transporter transmembrane domain-containing protein [Lyngbya sp. CCY1209]|uniref:ABC transporter transmembrane domain-containing protein n=1 Tax=Lyngbya sp. CCY1209 TaxID=2886103 RepID=UPI002D210687|nr:ABC transporter transmembrane domain-containing protein [Lyngbya sp. CCY1209]MEB3883683.1 ATP-binding cassette domain-containing protein [Lyngbya sp. CCY1209]
MINTNFPVAKTETDTNPVQVLERTRQAFQALLTEANAAPDAATHLSQFVEFGRTYELGEAILEYSPATLSSDKTSGSAVHSEHNHKKSLYLVCGGRVRLLAFDRAKEREVSVDVLGPGDCFGGDWEPCDRPRFPYQAVAASNAEIARLNLGSISLPELEAHLQTVARRRSHLIFFKTQTDLRSRPSRYLKAILPEVAQRHLEAGTPVGTLSGGDPARFWLYGGEIDGTPAAPNVGDGWGPEPPPESWVARSAAIVLSLPQGDWDTLSPDTANRQNGGKMSAKVPKIAPALPAPKPAAEAPAALKDPSQAPALNFPKPKRRRPWGGFLRSDPFVEQQSSSDCGAACLAMISRYWGKDFGLNRLRNLAGVGRSGASLKGLARAAESLGYQARPVRASLTRLEDEKHPWIAHWQGDHYIVVYRVRGKQVWVGDPAQGKRKLSRSQFLDGWTGYALLLEATERLDEVPNQKRSLGRFMGLLWPHRSLGLQIILISILVQLFGVVTPLLTQIILDRVVVNNSVTSLHVFALGALIFGLWSLGLSSVRQYLLSYLSNRLDLTMISGFIRHALSLPLSFFETRRVGDIITRVQENQKIQRFLIGQILLAWLNLVTGFVYLGLMLYYNWRLTVLILGLIPPIVIVTLVSTPLLRRMSRKVFNAVADQNSTLVEMMTGVQTLKSVAAEQELRWRWEDRLTKQLNARFEGQKLGINLGLISQAINTVGSTALLWFGVMMVIQGDLTIGQFFAFNMMQGKVISPVLSLVGLWDELQEVLISVERLNDVFDSEPEEDPRHPLLVLSSVEGNVRFEDVTFRYSDDAEVNTLQNLSFEVQRGQTVAIVGRSGSGKSTLVKLLQRLYLPSSGRISVDGHDVSHISPQSLRQHMGVVPQECYLFSGTIEENIALYRDEYDLEDVVEAAKLAEAHAFIQSLPLGYNTKVGERGSSLSGGQRQRVAIARALLGKPPILVLDEATSSLDTESEQRFQRNLEQLSRDRTTFIIAHRLSTVRNADLILVLDRGVLVERGNHDELIAIGGLYHHLAQQQLDL